MPLARPGGSQARFLAEVGKEEQERNLAIVRAEYENYRNGIMPSGPGARDIVAAFATAAGTTGPGHQPPTVIPGEQQVRAMLAKRAKTLHLGPANYCWLSKTLDNQHYGENGIMPAEARESGLCKGVHAGAIGIISRRSRQVTYFGRRVTLVSSG